MIGLNELRGFSKHDAGDEKGLIKTGREVGGVQYTAKELNQMKSDAEARKRAIEVARKKLSGDSKADVSTPEGKRRREGIIKRHKRESMETDHRGRVTGVSVTGGGPRNIGTAIPGGAGGAGSGIGGGVGGIAGAAPGIGIGAPPGGGPGAGGAGGGVLPPVIVPGRGELTGDNCCDKLARLISLGEEGNRLLATGKPDDEVRKIDRFQGKPPPVIKRDTFAVDDPGGQGHRTVVGQTAIGASGALAGRNVAVQKGLDKVTTTIKDGLSRMKNWVTGGSGGSNVLSRALASMKVGVQDFVKGLKTGYAHFDPSTGTGASRAQRWGANLRQGAGAVRNFVTGGGTGPHTQNMLSSADESAGP